MPVPRDDTEGKGTNDPTHLGKKAKYPRWCLPRETEDTKSTDANLFGESSKEWGKQEARSRTALVSFSHWRTNTCRLGHGLTTLWPWASHFTSLCLSFLICKMGQYVIYLPHRGGMRIKKIKLQIIILGCCEGANSEPSSCWGAMNSINNPCRAQLGNWLA